MKNPCCRKNIFPSDVDNYLLYKKYLSVRLCQTMSDFVICPFTLYVPIKMSNLATRASWKFWLHTLCFIRNVYKERFWPLVKFLGKIRNGLAIFKKIKEQKLWNILKIPNSLREIDLFGLHFGIWERVKKLYFINDLSGNVHILM